jgi:hypothetical protein
VADQQSVNEQFHDNGDLEGQDEPDHPFHQEQFALDRGHVVVSLAEGGRGLQSLFLGNVDRTKRLENLALQYGHQNLLLQ